MNVNLANYQKWTLDEMIDRNTNMVEKALSIWPMVTTNYKPDEDILDTVSLSEDYLLKGKKIIKYLYKGMEEVTNSWVDMYLSVVSKLHEEDPTRLYRLAIEKTSDDLNPFINDNDNGSRYYTKIDEGIYVWVNTSTSTKISLLRKLFSIFGVEEDELTFYLKDGNSQKDDFKTPRHAIRYKFWEYALPLLKEGTGKYKNVNPSISNWQATYIGISGIGISSIANLNELRAEIYIGTSNTNLNTMIFEHLFSIREEIENKAGVEFTWTNIEDNNSKKIGLTTHDLGIANENNWEQCANFLIEGVKCILEFIVPELISFYESKS